MPFILNMPKLSPTMSEGTITKWHKRVGDHVEAGDVLLEIATDKATVEHAALDEGYLRVYLVAEGKEAQVGDPIALFSEKKEESIEAFMPKPEPAPKKSKKSAAVVASAGGKEAAAPEGSKAVSALYAPKFVPEAPLTAWLSPSRQSGDRLFASPLARRLARDKGLDLATVRGTGPRGRVVARDLSSAEPAGVVAFNREETPKMAPGSYEEIPLSHMRKVIAQRLQDAKSFIPHFYVEQEFRAEALVSLREQLKGAGMKITVNDFILRAVALALRSHPVINSGFNSETLSRIAFKTIDVAVAVSVDGGADHAYHPPRRL